MEGAKGHLRAVDVIVAARLRARGRILREYKKPVTEGAAIGSEALRQALMWN
jgi:hypothetical protein